ncbi:histone acetyltransferase [Hanseniaspora uvarum]|nr:histone acetyltransferase [Hanseniaspora uvarum]
MSSITTNNSCSEQIEKYHTNISKYIKTSEEDSKIDIDNELQLTLTALFDTADVLSEKEPKNFCQTFLPSFIYLLNHVECSMLKSDLNNTVRHTILEILGKAYPYIINLSTSPELIQSENQQSKPSIKTDNMVIPPNLVEPLFNCFYKNVLIVDNDVNAVLALKFINNIFKFFRYFLLNQVGDFLENFLYPLYRNAATLIQDSFSTEKESTDDSQKLIPGFKSFKVLAECPVSVVSIFSSFKSIVPAETEKYLPLVMEFLDAQVKSQQEVRENFENAQIQKLKASLNIDPAAELTDSQNFRIQKNIQRYCSVAPSIVNMNRRDEFGDLLTAQIKCASFLVYIFLRNYVPELLQKHAPRVPGILCRLLQDLPADMTHLRKELLQTIRHIFSTPYKKLFITHLPVLLNEDVLLSQGFTNNDILRTLALSNIADLIHNLRGMLSLDQIETSINLFIKYLHDTSLQTNVHIMSSKLLTNLVDSILAHGKESPQYAPRARKLIISIVEGFIVRLKMLNYSKDSIVHYQELYAKRKQREYDELPSKIKESDREEFIKNVIFKNTESRFEKPKNDDSAQSGSNEDEDVDMDLPSNFAGFYMDRFDIKDHSPILITSNTTYTNVINVTNREKMRDSDPASLLYGAPIKDALYLYRTLLPFLKSVISDLRQFNPPPNDFTENQKTWYTLARIFTLEETKLFKTLFHETLKGFMFFTNKVESKDKSSSDGNSNAVQKKKYFDIRSPNLPLSVSRESRDLMESFVVIFMHLDIPTFSEIVESEMEFFYQCILQDSAVLHVAQSFLTGEVTSPAFNSILLRFLSKKLPTLGDADINVSNIIIRLYKLSFMSVNVFPAKNEQVLLTHINDIVLDSLKYATQTHESLVYFYLIRTLFRCIGGGKLENLYLALIPVLNTLLETLNNLINQTKTPYAKNLYVEICLTIPVKLVVLAPLFSKLLKPLCISLQCHEQTDLIQQGLRTLELCVDTFNSDYLDPLIEPSSDKLFTALFGLLKPIPGNPQNSHTAVRILGKLGGRNRKFLKPPTDLNFREKYPEILASCEIYGLSTNNSLNNTVINRSSSQTKTVESGVLGVSGWNRDAIQKDLYDMQTQVDSGINTSFSIASCVEDVLKLFYDPGCETEYRLKVFDYLTAVLKITIGSGLEESQISQPDLLWKVSKLLKDINENNFEDSVLNLATEKMKDLSKFENLIIDLIDSVFFATSIPELVEPATLFLLNLADHFTICHLAETVEECLIEETALKMETVDPAKNINSTIFIKSLINSLGNYNSDTRKTAVLVTERLFITSEVLLKSQPAKNDVLAKNLLVMNMFKEFIHGTTNEEFYIKCGCVLGLHTIITKFIDSEYIHFLIKKYQISITSAMFFVLEDTKTEYPHVIVTRTTDVICQILSSSLSPMTDEQLQEDKFLLHSLSEVICYLNSPAKATRDASKQILDMISEKTKLPISSLMRHSKTLLLKPIFSKPLRALPIPIIIGNVEAVTYCLKTTEQISSSDELLRFLAEVIALVDADDKSLSGNNKVADYLMKRQLVNLRVTCINLLSASVANEHIASSKDGQTRLDILNLFFKTMTKDSNEIIDATYEGLKTAITSSNYKLPKEVLQPGLKPLLINLSDRENLSAYRLKALTRVLEILNSHFKLEVGKKLLDHLDWKSNVMNLDLLADQDIIGQTPTEILVHIINMFHLLPNQADIFLKDLVTKVMRLENKLRCHLDSPFRVPLARFLDRFHESAAEYMTKNLSYRIWVSFICAICQLPEAKNLYQQLKSRLPSYVETFKKAVENTPDRCVSFYASVIDLVNTVFKMEGTQWLHDNSNIMNVLLKMTVDVKRTVKNSGFYFDHTQLNLALNNFQELYIDLIKNGSKESETAYFMDFVCCLFDSEVVPHEDFKDLIFNKIVDSRTADPEQRIEYLNVACAFIVDNMEKPISLFLAESVVKDVLVFEGSYSGNLNGLLPSGPLTVESLKDTWFGICAKNIWANDTLLESNIIQSQLDFLKFEFINLTASLVKWAPDAVRLYKENIIEFGWSFIKMKDELCKQASYMLFSMFIPVFGVNSQVITPIFVSLLRNEQTEGRFLVSQSLDLLIPEMYKRHQDENDADEWLTWVKWIRRVLSEEKSSQNLLIYHLLCGFPDEFFSVRELFVPNIINYLDRLFKRQSSGLLESQNLAMDLLELILKWEEKHISLKKEQEDEDRMDVEIEEPGKSGSVDSIESNASQFSMNYEISYNLRETCVSSLIKYLCSASSKNSDILLNLKGLDLLSKFLSKNLWSDVKPSLDYYEKTLIFTTTPADNIIPYIINYLQVFEIVLEQRPADWICQNITYLSTLLKSCLSSSHNDIQRSSQKLLKIILKAIVETNALEKEAEILEKNKAMDDDDDVDVVDNPGISTEEKLSKPVDENAVDLTPCLSFVNNIVLIISRNLAIHSSSVSSGVMLAWTLFINIPAKVDSLLPNLLTTFNKLVNDHLNAPPANEAKAIEEARLNLKLIEYSFFILSDKISLLNDQRRTFLSLIATVVDKSNDLYILKQILRMLRYWAFAGENYPTVKEVSAVLTRMLTLELKGQNELTLDYFELVISIFENRHELNSDFPIRMEHPFLVGTKIFDSKLRKRFMNMLNDSIETDIHERLYYIIKDQNWEYVGDSPWLNQATQLLYGSFNRNSDIRLAFDSKFPSIKRIENLLKESNLDYNTSGANVTDTLRLLIENEHKFVTSDLRVRAGDFTDYLSEIFYKAPSTIRSAWVSIFPVAFKSVQANELYGMNRSLVALLSKDYHVRQSRSPMNVIGALLEGFKNIESIDIPPHLLKYLALTHNAWFESLYLLEESLTKNKLDNGKNQEIIEDAILELYSTLSEKDMFYGLWRRRATYSETIAALSYEQIGMFDKAQQLYESAQVKTRANALPYLESEYSLWEDGWIYCAQELQQWEILTDIAHDEAYTDLMVECAWRTANWNVDRPSIESSLKGLLETPTPRRQLLEAFVGLQKQFKAKGNDAEVKRMIEDGIQISLAKWATLPKRVSEAHIPLLHIFQEFTEMSELQLIYKPLFETTQANIEQKSSDIKRVLSNWRERTPNQWDDLNIWNDLITWRTHVFDNINETYLPLLNSLPKGTKNVPNYYYKGYHEVAWVINRFAQVARIQESTEVCLDQLNKIYSLPNIEIHEAFLKLMEQAKCYYENPEELNTGIEVIGNTNLTYFSESQKSEFITMQGMFLTKKNDYEKANESFVKSIQLDIKLPKAWAEWGRYHDKRFTESKFKMEHASSAFSCYLQAASLYNNKESRQMLSKVLWFMSLKSESNNIEELFESSKQEMPTWYWITFIPQLISALSHKEAKMARSILIQIVKEFPQAVHFHLRTAREEYMGYEIMNKKAAANAEKTVENEEVSAPAETSKTAQTLEYLDEMNKFLKTSYPLLALTLEFLTDQVSSSKKAITPDETFYRVINTLLNEAHSTYQRLPDYNENVQLPEKIVSNIFKQCNDNADDGLKLKLVVDFVQTKPTFEAYIKRLRLWKEKINSKLSRYSDDEKFEEVFPYLTRFHQKKYEDIDIPGQYMLTKDNNKYFVKIGRFLSNVNFVVRANSSYRVLNIRGTDGSIHSFSIETPTSSSRTCRREERVIQMFRLMNDILERNVQTKKRNISFTTPVSVSFSLDVKLHRYSKKHKTLQDIFEEYCESIGMDKNKIYDYYIEQIKAANNKDLPKPDTVAAKVEILSTIQQMYLSKNVLKDYFKSLYKDFESFWVFRKTFTVKYATHCLMTYMMSVGNRTPSRIHIHVENGDVFSTEFVPNKVNLERLPEAFRNNIPKLANDAPILQLQEHLPFRLTPNIQRLIGDVGLEGIFSTTMLLLSKGLLSSQENDVRNHLNLLIKNEVISWYSDNYKGMNVKRLEGNELEMLSIVQLNTELIVRKLISLSHFSSQFAASNHFVLEAISTAVSPRNLTTLDITSMPYF